MLWMPGDVISSVWPSGSALATTSAPMFPPAPGRFSTTTGWPSVLASSSPTARARTSTSPPAGNGAIMRMGFVGQVCAAAADARPAVRIRNAANVRGNRRMTPPLPGDYEPNMGASMLVADALMSTLSCAVFHMNRITKSHLNLINCDHADYRNVMLAALYRAAFLTPGRI